MRIVVNTRFLLPGRLEGFGWFTYEIFRRMAAAHPEHEFVFLFDRPFDERFLFSENVRGRVVWPPARHPFLFVAWYEGRLPGVLAQEKADLFISPDGYCSLRAKTPTLLVTHDLAYCHYPEHISRLNLAYMRWFMPRFSRRAERIATVSDFSKRDIALQHGVPLDKIDVVYNGCDQRFVGVTAAQKEALTLQVTGGRPYLLYVGSIHPRKNLPALLRAYETFRETHPEVPLQLVLAGRMAWQTGEVGRTLAAMRYRNDVHLTGYVPDNELPTLIAGAFAVVYVSLFEGFGLPILEAQQAGTAVICSNTSSMPEVAGDAAVLVDPTNPAAIARGISQLWDEPGLREALLARGAANAARFSWDRSAAALWESALRTLR